MDIFSGKVAIVTGGASGIGRALGEELARSGAKVVLGDIQTDQLDSVVNAMTQSEYSVKAITLDVTDFEAVKAVVSDTLSQYGRLDYIFNNAGIAVAGEVRDFTTMRGSRLQGKRGTLPSRTGEMLLTQISMVWCMAYRQHIR
jgi:NAD(P)-dependent dehydrogenase (short-subunit alcohol dehydrogenase family)